MTRSQLVPSASIVIAWELGAGMGHLMPMLPLVKRFVARGHRVSLVVRDLSRVTNLFSDLNVRCIQAPVKTQRSEQRIATPRNFAHILHNCGYGNYEELRGLAEGWRSLFQMIHPDLILCDHAPTAVLAARGTPALVAITGTGFCCPPDMQPWPDFRPWMPPVTEQLVRDEGAVLENVNRLLAQWRQPPLERLGQIFGEVDECFLATFRELDHYPSRPPTAYWGAWPNRGGEKPVWPRGGHGKRVFAYLHRFPALPDLLRLLTELQLPTLAYCDPLPAEMRQRLESASLHFVDRPQDLEETGRQCDLAILNGGHGATVSMLLAGKPILQIPCQLEQTLTGLATAGIAAGLSAEPDKPVHVAGQLVKLVTSDELAAGAARFAARYADFDSELQLDRLADRIDALLAGKRRVPSASSGNGSTSDGGRGGVHLESEKVDADGRTILIGIGSGRCGTLSLSRLLSHQASTVVGHEMRPLLPWSRDASRPDVCARIHRLLAWYPQVARVGDVAQYYLPYVEELLNGFDDVRVICLQRDRAETVDSFLRWIATTRQGRPVNHWAASREGLEPDEWDASFPKYAALDMPQAIGRYWDEYYQAVERLVDRFPERIRVFPMQDVLNNGSETRRLLDWIGIPAAQQQVVSLKVHSSASDYLAAQVTT